MTIQNTQKRLSSLLMAAVIAGMASNGWAFESNSTGADGAFSPTVNTQLQLPPDGIFNFTNVTIPQGVTVTFLKNVTNTPVTILASGDVTIDGTLSVNGTSSPNVGASGDGNPGDDGLPGIGGPGGFDGGRGGTPVNIIGSAGLGPGAGLAARNNYDSGGCGGSGGGYVSNGAPSRASTSTSASRNTCRSFARVLGGTSYGSQAILPLIGGSGGGGASAGTAFGGSGGGGGGGAILIAASGTVAVNGAISANGGRSGNGAGTQSGASGGGGSGGAVRIIATTIAGNGSINANGGAAGSPREGNFSAQQGGNGASGRIRLEAEIFTRTAGTSPTFSFAEPQEVFVAGLPGLRITSVAGIAAPASPTGSADIILPESTPNPVTIEFATNGVPVGNTVELRVTPVSGASSSVVSGAITGTEEAGVTSVSIDLPDGPSVLSAEVSFTVTIAMQEQFDYSRFAQGEAVERVRLSFDPVQGSLATLVTATGKEFTWPSSQLLLPSAGTPNS